MDIVPVSSPKNRNCLAKTTRARTLRRSDFWPPQAQLFDDGGAYTPKLSSNLFSPMTTC